MTDRLLPPIRAEELVPGRLAAQGQRVRRGELTALQTPRTYRMSDPTYRTTTSGATTLGSMPIFLQPDEILGLMCTVDIRSTAASTGFVVYVDNTTTPWGGSDMILGIAPTLSVRITHASAALGNGGTVYFPTPTFPGSFRFFMNYRESSGGIRKGPAVPTEYSPKMMISRSSGSGTLQTSDFNMWAMVL